MGHDAGSDASSWPIRFAAAPPFHLDTDPLTAYTGGAAIEPPCQLANVEHTTGEAQRDDATVARLGWAATRLKVGCPFLFSIHFLPMFWAVCCHMQKG
jgi:hypothetical protein